MKKVSWFVNGTKYPGGLTCGGPFDTEEEAIAWAKTHVYKGYKVIEEVWTDDLPKSSRFHGWPDFYPDDLAA